MQEERAIKPAIIDEVPVGKGQTQMFDEYPPGYDPNQEQQQTMEIPLKNRMKSKIVKQRLSAYEDIIRMLQEGDQEGLELTSSDLYSFIQDPNLHAQEKGLNGVLLWLEKNAQCDIDVKEITKNVIEKVLVQSKPSVKKLGIDILILFFERGQFQKIQESILLCSCQKNPKIVCASIQTMIELLHQFGFKKCDSLKNFWSKAEELSQSQQSIVKNEAMVFYKEVGRWMGKSIEGKIQKLKKEQQEEILKSVEGIHEAMKPIRGTAEDVISLKDLKEFDAYDHVEAVDVLAKYPDSWCEKVLAQEKWLEKKELLEQLLKSVQVTKIQPNGSNLYPIVQMLKKLINYNNVAIQLIAIKIAGCMASGLRKNFSQSCKIILNPLMQKLKDKKQQVIDEVNVTIKKLFLVLTLDDFMDDIKEILEDKAWGARVNAIQVIEFYLDNHTKPNLIKLQSVRNIPMTLKKFCEDGSVEVREKTLTVYGKLQGKVYEGSLKKEFADLKPDKISKINIIAQPFITNKEDTEVVEAPKANKVVQVKQPPPLVQQQPAAQPVQQQPPQKKEAIKVPQPQPQPQLQTQPQPPPTSTTQRMIEEPMKPQSVFQNKEQRIHLELQNPFPISTLSEAHIETLKQMFQLPGIPTHLLVGLFSLNQNSNLRAIRFIRTKLNKASELSDILFKWSFTIGWFRESVQLQSEILQFLNFLLFQLKQENYEIHSTEIRIIKGYLHMLVYLLCRSSQSLFAQRTIPIVMQILHSTIQLPAMFLQTRDTIRFDDDDEINKVDILRRTKAFIEQIGLRLNDWSVNDCARNRQIVSDLICSISSLKQTPVQPPIQHAPIQQYQQTTSFGQQKQPRQFTPTHVCIPTQPTTPAIVIEEEVSVKRARSFSPLNRYQQVVPTIQPLNKQRSEHYHVVSEQVRQFQVMTRQFGGNDPKVNSCHLIDLAITIGVTLFQLRDQDLITEYCTELGNLMQNDLQSLPYQKFFELISWMFNQMLSEVKSKDNNLILSKLNGAMVRILTGSDVTNIYLALMDTILRERSTNTNAQSLSQQISLATRCLNKVLSNESAKKLPLQSLSMILDRFNDYLSKFCQFPDGKPPDVTRRGDDILAKAMKTAILIFVKNSGPGEILHVLEQLRLGPSSHLNRWVMEQVDENEEKQVGTLASKRYSLYRHQNLTDPAQIRGVLEGLARNDEYFEKNLDLLITFLKRNKGFDWKSQLPNDHPRLGYMEERIELATMDLNVKLEKKVVELTSLKETMNQ